MKVNYAFITKTVRSFLFMEKLFHMPVPEKCFVFNTGNCLRILSDTDDHPNGHHHRRESC